MHNIKTLWLENGSKTKANILIFGLQAATKEKKKKNRKKKRKSS